MSPPPLSADNAAYLASIDGSRVPLLGVAVSARVFGAHARVVVRQRYRNDEPRAIEAIYTFPVPSEAALVGFAMECAGRRVEAEVQEREAAFRAYDEALAKGHGAALLEEERRNVFTASVGNLLPGEETMIEIVYVEALAADEGALRFVVPTLVAPRYIPGVVSGAPTGHGISRPTDRVPDADRISPAIGAVDYGLAIDVVFDLGRAVTIESPSHAITARDAGEGATRVSFACGEVPLDRDLVLVAAGAPGVAAGLVAERKIGEEGTFAFTVIPDLFDPDARAAGKDVVFVVDVSGSMEGDSLREAKSALRLCLRQLREGDRFQIIAFSDAFETFAPALVPYTQSTLSAADRWVAGLAVIGGTEMLEPLVAATGMLAELKRDRLIVLLTDGQVGNEGEIVERVVASANRARVYTFGIGTNVSDLLLRDLARRTRGEVTFIHPGERIDEKVTAQFSRATAARVSHVSLRFRGVDAAEMAPAEYGDLVDGEPWVVCARYDEPGHGKAELRGLLRGKPFYLEVPFELPAEASREGLTALWARARIRDLEEAELSGRRAAANHERIVALSIAHRVASKDASFVLVEKRTGDRRSHDLPEPRPIPVHAPAGWALAQAPMEEGSMVGGFGGGGYASGAVYAAGSIGAPFLAEADVDYLMDAGPATGRAYAAAPAPAAFAPPPPACAPGPQGYAAYEAEPSCEAVDLPAEPEPEAARADDDPLAALFATQLASGLFGGEGDGDEAQLAATTRALEVCEEAGIDSGHAVYGAQVRKALEALCALAQRLDASADDLGRALEIAAKLASGRRLQATVAAALAAARAR